MSVSQNNVGALLKQFPNSLLAGAYVDSLIPYGNDSFPVMHMTAISSDRIQVASVVIENSITDAQGAEDRVKKLKKYGLNEENSFAFLFACFGRGMGLYGKTNVESSLFRKYFPSTLLIGLFGNGEIGFNHRTSATDREPTERVRHTIPFLYYHTCPIFCHLIFYLVVKFVVYFAMAECCTCINPIR